MNNSYITPNSSPKATNSNWLAVVINTPLSQNGVVSASQQEDVSNRRKLRNKYINKEQREDILSRIIEGKEFEEIKESYPDLSEYIYDDYVRNTRYWFSFSDKDLFKKKIKGEAVDEELTPLDLYSSTLDVEALVYLIRCGRSEFIELYQKYSYSSYQDIAKTWKILAEKDFEKPDWCNEDALLERKVEANKKRSKSNTTTKNDIEFARNYLKFIDKDLPGMAKSRPNKKRM